MKDTDTQQKNTWVKPRHFVTTALLRTPFKWVMRSSYHYTFDKYKLDDHPHLILSNHQTKMDQFFVSLIFNKPVYYIARDDIFSMKMISKAIRYLVAPIPKNKVSKDIGTIRSCMRVAKENGNIGLFPEGNLTFSGETETIDISTAKLVKLLKLPLIFVNIKGGYAALPRWGSKVRRAQIHGSVVCTCTYEDYKDFTLEQILRLIKSNLYVKEDGIAESKHYAEYLETMAYVCPECGLTQFVSHGDRFVCKGCGKEYVYAGGRICYDGQSVSPKEWYERQKSFVSNLQLVGSDKLLFEDEIKSLRCEIKRKKKEVLVKQSHLFTYSDRIEIKSGKECRVFRYCDIEDMAILGRNKIEINANDNFYYIKPNARFNALKNLQIFYHYKNQACGRNDDYLGL